MSIDRMSKRLFVMLIALLNPIASAFSADRVSKIVFTSSMKCLDVPGGATAPKTELKQWACLPTAIEQDFRFSPDNDLFTISSTLSKLCLESPSEPVTSGVLVQNSCDKKSNSQKFLIHRNSDNSVSIRSGNKRLCMAVKGGSLENNASVVMEPCGKNGGPKIRLPAL
jgi:hypothetical protein